MATRLGWPLLSTACSALVRTAAVTSLTCAHWVLETDDEIGRELACWSAVVDWERPADLVRGIARRLADNEIVGWPHGRAEFGPRALRARSILADPRCRSQRDRVNLLVKQRESYRPFAPVAPAAQAGRYFDLPPGHAGYSPRARRLWAHELRGAGTG